MCVLLRYAMRCDATGSFFEILYSRTGEKVPDPALFLSRLYDFSWGTLSDRPCLQFFSEGSARLTDPFTSNLSVCLICLGLQDEAARDPGRCNGN